MDEAKKRHWERESVPEKDSGQTIIHTIRTYAQRRNTLNGFPSFPEMSILAFTSA